MGSSTFLTYGNFLFPSQSVVTALVDVLMIMTSSMDAYAYSSHVKARGYIEHIPIPSSRDNYENKPLTLR